MWSFARPAALRRFLLVAAVLAITLPFFAAVAVHADPTITEYPLGSGASGPEGIVTGPDGNLWIGVQYSNQIAKVTPGGAPTVYNVPNLNGHPLDIAVGFDNRLWFAEYGGSTSGPGELGRIDTNGKFAPIPLGRPMRLWGVTRGPDGNMWFTEFDQAKIARIAPDGSLASLVEFPTTTPASFPSEIIAGPDGNLWFSEEGVGKIGRITTAGAVTEWDVPTPNPGPCGIAVGPDGNIWFAEQDGNKIGHVNPTTGNLQELPPLAPNSNPVEMTKGPDGNVWFAEGGQGTALDNKVARVTPDGAITEYSAPTLGSSPYGLTTGPGNTLWFTEDAAGAVGVLTPTATGLSNKLFLPLILR